MRVREPFNAGSHFVGFLLAALGTWYLLQLAIGRTQLLAFGVYGATLLLLYGASTCYHGLPLGAIGLRRLRTLDHIAIYFLIAGTYTPVAAITLRESEGPALLAASWTIAAAGIPFKIRWLDAPVWVSTGTYLGMGYLALVAVVPLAREVGPGLGWLVAGGIAYTVGAIIYAVERPDPLPGRFGHHGLWHLLVLAGSACHFTFIVLHVASI
jgi:hemolysin III